MSFARRIMPDPAVAQIRRSSAWVRRAKQLGEISVTFFRRPPARFRFACHSDYSSKDLGGAGRARGGYVIGATGLAAARGLLAPWRPLVW